MNRLSLVLLFGFVTNCCAAGEPIRLHPENPRWFEWRGEAIALITSGEHYGAVVNPDFDYQRYLATLHEDGLNYTRVFAGAFIEPPGAHGIDQNTLAPAEGRFLAPWARSDVAGYAGGGAKFDFDRFNPEYLDRLRSFLRAADERGVVVELTFFSSTYTDAIWAVSPLNPASNVQATPVNDWRVLHTTDGPAEVHAVQERLVRWLVRSLNDHDNLFYEVQNEPWADIHSVGDPVNPYFVDKPAWPNAPEIPTAESVAWQARLVEAIRDEESRLPKRHLVAQNVANFRLALREQDLAGADFVNFHYAYPEAVSWNRGYRGAVGYDETGFAGSDDATYRRQAWNFVLSGGALFNHLDYSFAVGAEDGSKPVATSPGGGSAALRRQLGVLSDFLHGFELAELRPDAQLVRHAPGVVTRALSAPGRQHAVYLEGRGPTELTVQLTPGSWLVEWLSPLDGGVLASDTIEATERPVVLPSPEFDAEVAVRLTRK